MAWLALSPPRNLSLASTRSFALAAPVQAGKKSASSSQWIQRQRNDPYVRARASTASSPSSTESPASTAFVSRAAFKLIDLQHAWKGDVKLLRLGMSVVDLGAAPGGWIQAAQHILQGRATVVGVDLLPLQRAIGERDGVRFVQGDFLDPAVQRKLRQAVAEATGKDSVDLVLSDMMGNMTGSTTRDGTISLELCRAALAFALDHLEPIPLPPADPPDAKPPTANALARILPVQLVLKHFASGLTAEFRNELQAQFRVVKWIKPASSRKNSKEGFFVCAGFRGRDVVEAQRREGTASDSGGGRDEEISGGLYF
ncbi:hypothetical protein Rhopal_004065-T1 [Rhodotorula paludigena]|uniref:rRNA methyltransferase 2, mitochondrial n=1 Tax=Rhodotorula paludigena TaxID=86838 RepID=A0AAV5GNF3_9BASI|nr:hypothetical protein Rhopal_004065-T1 [Rhodotorula paludigena]